MMNKGKTELMGELGLPENRIRNNSDQPDRVYSRLIEVEKLIAHCPDGSITQSIVYEEVK